MASAAMAVRGVARRRRVGRMMQRRAGASSGAQPIGARVTRGAQTTAAGATTAGGGSRAAATARDGCVHCRTPRPSLSAAPAVEPGGPGHPCRLRSVGPCVALAHCCTRSLGLHSSHTLRPLVAENRSGRVQPAQRAAQPSPAALWLRALRRFQQRLESGGCPSTTERRSWRCCWRDGQACLSAPRLLSGAGLVLTIVTPSRVTSAPPHCTGLSVSCIVAYPAAAANTGGRARERDWDG